MSYQDFYGNLLTSLLMFEWKILRSNFPHAGEIGETNFMRPARFFYPRPSAQFARKATLNVRQ